MPLCGSNDGTFRPSPLDKGGLQGVLQLSPCSVFIRRTTVVFTSLIYALILVSESGSVLVKSSHQVTRSLPKYSLPLALEILLSRLDGVDWKKLAKNSVGGTRS